MEGRIKSVRIMNGMNQAEMAERIGVTVASISAYETGIRNPSNTTVAVICEKFDINESWLRTGEGPMMRETPRTVVDELARAYNLTPAVTRLLDAIAQAFVELDEEQADRILERLRMALSGAGDAALAHDEITRQMKEGPDESGPEIREESPAE